MIFVFAFTGALICEVKAQTYDDLPSISIGLGYFGELITHPGVMVYTEIALNKNRNQVLARLNLIHYKHSQHSKNLLLLPEFVFRRNTKSLNYYEAFIGAGVLYQKADRTVYEYHQNKFIRNNSGWFYFVPSAGFRYSNTIRLDNGDVLNPNIGGKQLSTIFSFLGLWLYPSKGDTLLG